MFEASERVASMKCFSTILQPGSIRKILGLALLMSGFLFVGQVSADPKKRAVIFIDPEVTFYESQFQYHRIEIERGLYIAYGYDVEIKKATEDEIVAAIVSGDTDHISFFGHGHGSDNPSATSTMLFLNATAWKARVQFELVKKYRAEGLSPTEARERANRESQNFGLEGMRNHSCSSLVDTTLAEAFVKPGGTYSGVGGLYVSCPTPMALLSDVDFFLDDYIVPLPAPAGDLITPAALCRRLGPADGCMPGSANCVPCPGENPTAWYDPTRWPVAPAE